MLPYPVVPFIWLFEDCLDAAFEGSLGEDCCEAPDRR